MTKLPYESHQYANLFPLDEGKPLWEMSDDIKLNGLQVPIVLYQDKVLDGRRRLLACLRVGVEPKYRKFSGGDTAALAFVVSHNLHRRHLGTGDRSLIAAKVAKITQEREPDGKFAERRDPDISNADAASMLNVSERSVRNAKTVLDNGTPELQKAVEQHVVSVSDAAKIASEPPKVQRAAVAKVKAGKATTAASTVKPVQLPGTIPCPRCGGKGRIARAEQNDLFDAVVKITGADPKVSASHVVKVCKLLGGADPPYTAEEVLRLPNEFKKAGWKNVRVTVGMVEKYVGWVRTEGPKGGGLYDGIFEWLKGQK